MSNLNVLNAILYVAEHGCKWRRPCPSARQTGTHLHAHEPLVQAGACSIGLFEQLQRSQVVRIRIEAVSLDSTII
jgi:hypothetical protein